MHILDTVGAMLVADQTDDGVAIRKFASIFTELRNIQSIGCTGKTALLPTILAQCSAAHCAEIDDYHLESCTTPGAVIVPTALSLASLDCYLADPSEFLVAVALGYEILIRLGLGIEGPKVLYQGVWPTYLSAALGSATVTARALKLDAQQTTSALSTALSLSTGAAGRFMSPFPSRMLTLGVAAQNGVVAAFSAQEGFTGDEAILDRTLGRVNGIVVSQDKLVDELGMQYFIDHSGIKPYPVARQALSAIEAFREILTTSQLTPESIEDVTVWVPERFIGIIDHPNLPANHRESMVSVQFQMAILAFDPNSLLDAKRDNLRRDERIKCLIERIHVKPSEELERYYPAVWPARVEVRAGGQKYSYEMLHPRGDPRNRFSWQEVISKFGWVARSALDDVLLEKVPNLVREIEVDKNLAELLELFNNNP